MRKDGSTSQSRRDTRYNHTKRDSFTRIYFKYIDFFFLVSSYLFSFCFTCKKAVLQLASTSTAEIRRDKRRQEKGRNILSFGMSSNRA